MAPLPDDCPGHCACTDAAPLRKNIRRYTAGVWDQQADIISREIPIRIHTEFAPPKELWAWPCDLPYLALGHVLLDLGGMRHSGTVTQLSETEFNVLLRTAPPSSPSEPGTITGKNLLAAMASFMNNEGLWDDTGCFHRAGILNAGSLQILHRAEDIGRHNCLDRLAGWAHQHDIDLSGTVLLVSARVTASLCAKALRAGFRCIVSRSAVTTASIEMALEHKVTLIGFARDKEGRFSIYADAAGRILE